MSVKEFNEDKDYFYCTRCNNFFTDPKEWHSPCCGATDSKYVEDGSNMTMTCSECGEEFGSDEHIPVCPHCENNGGERHTQPDYIVNFDSWTLLNGIKKLMKGGER
jgi:hypothetical protein